ncbi:hypothetical protein [Rhodococcus sp. APC 3903]|uniref:hypothetical protein n=1 Tax=Rhodococcus sp. APC 3903 TaxID=3035193 RepID=UPI0025B29EA0|nr:hypothetical protein [Rhodococcus sp. APC 3903]MDN3460671.1 hypothetical protein [Rhodococcus sp. APC 3903]
MKKDLFWDLPESRQTLRNYFGDVRTLATDTEPRVACGVEGVQDGRPRIAFS